jgi:hypothetical protein
MNKAQQQGLRNLGTRTDPQRGQQEVLTRIAKGGYKGLRGVYPAKANPKITKMLKKGKLMKNYSK